MAQPIPNELFDLMAARFSMLCDASRLAILHCLMEGEKNVSQIIAETSLGKTNVSKHLKRLADSGLLARRKNGLQVFYRLDDPIIEKLCRMVCDTILKDFEQQAARQRAPRSR